MKKIVSVLAAILFLSGSMFVPIIRVEALEACTLEEMQQQTKEEEVFPDPEASYTEVTKDSLVFHVYDAYAVLAECEDREITEITIPAEVSGLPVIGVVNSPFGFCRKLTTITLPDTLKYFDWWGLVSTTIVRIDSTEEPVPSVSEVFVSDTNPYYTVFDGLVYSKDMKTVIGCPPAKEMKELQISELTETINDYAFAGCIFLETAKIPETVKHIHNAAFAVCPNLMYAELPESITAISGEMFYYCTSLSEVEFKGTIKKIGYGAFSRCSALVEFTIPETVFSIGSNAFEESGCAENVNGVWYVGNWVVGSDSEIQSAVLRNGTVGIAELSFFVRSQLSYLDIPRSVKYVGDLCYAGLSSGKPSVVRYGADSIGEKTIAPAKTMTDLYILDSECEIFDSEKAIPATYKYMVPQSEPEFDAIDWESGDTVEYDQGDIVIHGFADSTAQAYAEKYNRKFSVIEVQSQPGDVNADGKYSIADLVIMKKWLTSDPGAYLLNWEMADMNHDGKLNVVDMTLMKRKLLQQ